MTVPHPASAHAHRLPADLAPGEAPSSRTPFICRRPVRLSIYAFLVLFLFTMLGLRYIPGLLDPTFEKHIQSKRVIVGMSKEQVLKAWGSPYTINITSTQDGMRREEWIYED